MPELRASTVKTRLRRLGIGGAREGLECLRAGHVPGAVGKVIECRFLVDENLVIETPGLAAIEQAYGYLIMSALPESIEQVGSALAAEAALGPLGRRINADVLLAVNVYLLIAFDGQQRAAAPCPAHIAVAGAHAMAGDRGTQADGTAQAGALALLGC